MTEMPELLFPPFNKSSQPLTVEEVAGIIRKDPRTVRRYARMKIIPGYQDIGKGGGWRFPRKEIEKYCKERGII